MVTLGENTEDNGRQPEPLITLDSQSPVVSVECDIEMDLESEAQAQAILKAIELDNGPYAKASVNGKTIRLECEAKSMPSMLHTLEDLLACIRVAEEMTAAGKKC
jgi:tRNA threonylcarbamoyladenosine modification (KEOPS) complex  Pcc1 subunit